MIAQANRLLSIATPLGKDKFLVEEFEGTETLSTPFEFRLSLLSSDDSIDHRSIIGREVAVTVRDSEGGRRVFHGRVTIFSCAGFHERGFRRYEAVIRPWIWFLSKRKTCRIFQGSSVPEIVTSVFEGAGFSDFKFMAGMQDHQKLEYCVQYNETDLDFVHRLLEEHGIYYYFRHDEGRHLLVLSDGISGYQQSVPKNFLFESGSSQPNTLASWARRMQFVSGQWSQADFNFMAPSVKLFSASPSVVLRSQIRRGDPVWRARTRPLAAPARPRGWGALPSAPRTPRGRIRSPAGAMIRRAARGRTHPYE